MKKRLLLCLTVFATSLSVNAQTSFRVRNSGESVKKSSSVQKAVTGALTCNTQYVAGTTMDLNFTLALTNTDGEWCDLFTLTFPAGITPNTSASNTDPMDPNASPLATTSALNPIVGQSISWGQDEDANQWGGITTEIAHDFTVNVTIGAGVTGDLTATFIADGDTYLGGAGTVGDLSGSTIIYPAGATIIDVKADFTAPTAITSLNNCGLTTSKIVISVINFSTVAVSNIPVGYSVNGGTPVSAVIPGPIDPTDTLFYEFTPLENFTAQNLYEVKSWAKMPADISALNDTTALTFTNSVTVPLTSTSYSNGIESEYDYNSVKSDWIGNGVGFGPSTGTIHSGAQALFYTVSTAMGAPEGTVAETFAILPCTDVVTGETYRISYWKKTNGTSNGMSGIFGGTSQDAAGMTTIIKGYSAITPTPGPTAAGAFIGIWAKDSADYVATTSGTMYFAIGAKGTVTAASSINVRLDDISIVKYVAPVGGLNENNIVASAFPNPTSDVFNIELNTVATNVSVIAMDGKVVSSKEINSKSISLNVASLNAGMYIYEIVSSNGTVSRSTFVKN